MGRHDPARLPRLAPDREPLTTRACPSDLRGALQHAQAAPSASPGATGDSTSPTSRELTLAQGDPPIRPPRRTHPRIRPSSVTDGFTHPTSSSSCSAASSVSLASVSASRSRSRAASFRRSASSSSSETTRPTLRCGRPRRRPPLGRSSRASASGASRSSPW
jgi:hypothetical protein